MNTNKAKHTPGPWRLFKAPQGGWGVGKSNSHTEIFYFEKYIQAKRKYLSLRLPEMAQEEQQQARLIAAAPELLEVAEILSDAMGYLQSDGEIPAAYWKVLREKARAAIAKAKVDKFAPISIMAILVNIGIDISKGQATFYKTVNPNLTDFYTGKYQYKVGKGGEIKGLEVDQSIECGPGFHFTNIWNARGFASDKPFVIISATVKLKDILSVHQKIRCRKFSNVQIVKIEGLK